MKHSYTLISVVLFFAFAIFAPACDTFAASVPYWQRNLRSRTVAVAFQTYVAKRGVSRTSCKAASIFVLIPGSRLMQIMTILQLGTGGRSLWIPLAAFLLPSDIGGFEMAAVEVSH